MGTSGGIMVPVLTPCQDPTAKTGTCQMVMPAGDVRVTVNVDGGLWPLAWAVLFICLTVLLYKRIIRW